MKECNYDNRSFMLSYVNRLDTKYTLRQNSISTRPLFTCILQRELSIISALSSLEGMEA